LVAGDTNGLTDIFLRDRLRATTTLITYPGNSHLVSPSVSLPAISASGRYVVFWVCCNDFSFRKRVQPIEPPPRTAVVFLYDGGSGTTREITDPQQGGVPSGRLAISANGRYVAYACCSLGGGNFVSTIDTVSGAEISVGEGSREDPSNVSISSDGRFIAYAARAANLPSTTGMNDIYVWDRTTRIKTLVSVHRNGAPADHGSNYPSVNSDGTRIAFQSTATNLVSGDTNGASDVFVRGIG
jgi:Tol biopolymer transport system component